MKKSNSRIFKKFPLFLTIFIFSTGIILSNNSVIGGQNWYDDWEWLPSYPNYAPSGMPDFDQKQNNWQTLYPGENGIIDSSILGDDFFNPNENCIVPGPNSRLDTFPEGDDYTKWSFNGPVTVANCFWYLDSIFENATGYPDDGISDFPLVEDYGMGDDHSIYNVQLLINNLALEMNTCFNGKTYFEDMHQAIEQWIYDSGVSDTIAVEAYEKPTYELITEKIEQQNTILLLLGFYNSPLLIDQKQIHTELMLPVTTLWPGNIQSFIPTTSSLNSIQLSLIGVEDNWTAVKLSIFDEFPQDASILPIRETLKMINPPVIPEWIQFKFEQDLVLQPAHEYFIAVNVYDDEEPWNIHWCLSENDTYTPGMAWRCMNDYIYEPLYGQDFAFKTEYFSTEGTRYDEHYVSVAGINHNELNIALCDSINDYNFTPDPFIHNDAQNVSHDIYQVDLEIPLSNVDYNWWLWDYIDPDLGNYTIVEKAISIHTYEREPPVVNISKPTNGIYIGDKFIIGFFTPFIIGKITIIAEATDNLSGIEKVEFYIDNELQETVQLPPYEWLWRQKALGIRTFKVIAYDNAGNFAEQELPVLKFF